MQKLTKRIKGGLWVAFGGFLATVISLTVENIGVFDMDETQKAIVVIIGTAIVTQITKALNVKK